jgi:hypothetical protein
MRVRSALEEVGQSYVVRLVSFRAMKKSAHLALHPFGQKSQPTRTTIVFVQDGVDCPP